jgi:UDPglucose 6-dehydrogenase
LSFEVLSNPEFLAEGEAVKNLLSPDRVLIGSSMTSNGHAAVSTLTSIYSSWVDPAKIQTMSNSSAELAKLAANAMLAQRISSINSISRICEKTGADITDVQIALGSDSRIGSDHLRASVGFGGSCFEKDIFNLMGLSQSLSLPDISEYWSRVLQTNKSQSLHFARRAISCLKTSPSKRRRIAIFGWAFKKGTSDVRETPSAQVLLALLKESGYDITIFDPGCDPVNIQEEADSVIGQVNRERESPLRAVLIDNDPYTACKGAQAILVLTDWDQFRCRSELRNDSLVLFNDNGESSSKPSNNPNKIRNSGTDSANPSTRLKANLPCPPECRECSKDLPESRVESDQVGWRRISAAMERPRWIFDGRNVVDAAEMEKLGFRVVSIGKGSRWDYFGTLGGGALDRGNLELKSD